ncbi:MAG: hypothetical protein KC591_10915, partial [Gemmatimonadetes bacterium]|nr:hypothetical protein [Gemmatimonadota bacterium]
MRLGSLSGRFASSAAGASARPGGRIAILILLAFLLATSNAFAADVPAERASARATMKTFLGAVTNAAQSNDESKLDAAVACLDLTRAPGLDRAARRDLAIQLKEIIDRTRYVDYADIPDSPDAPPYVFARGSTGEIVIAGSESDDWQFTPDTVESIPAMLKEAMGRERVSGAADVPDYQRPVTWLRHHIPTGWRENGFLLEH